MDDKQLFLKALEYLENNDEQNYEGYYNGYGLMNMKDLNGDVPEIYICSGNRTAGKTFFFKRLMVRLALHLNDKFLFLTRKKTQLMSAGRSFIEDIENCHDFEYPFTIEGSDFAGVKMVMYGDKEVGYISYLNYADDIKEASNMFNSVCIGMKDEFQLRNVEDYCVDEIGKFRSIHKSCARGYNKQTRFLPMILCSNQLSLINPYFVAFGIHRRFSKQTKKMRGNGWVFQMTWNEQAARKSLESGFEKAFGEDEQSQSDNFNKFMDNFNMVGKQNSAKMHMILMFRVKNASYGLWGGRGFYYVSTKFEPNCKRRYAMDLASHTEDTILLQKTDPMLFQLKRYFENGLFRFESIECRVAIIDAIANTIL